MKLIKTDDPTYTEAVSVFRMNRRPRCEWCGKENPTDEWARLTKATRGFHVSIAPACVACATKLEKRALPEVRRFVKENGHA